MSDALKITVAGGGVAGLAVGAALAGRGHTVRVAERAPEIRAVDPLCGFDPNLEFRAGMKRHKCQDQGDPDDVLSPLRVVRLCRHAALPLGVLISFRRIYWTSRDK